MKLTFLNIVLLIVIGGLIFLFADQGCKKLKYKRQVVEYQEKYENCINTPVQIDTINDTIWIRGSTIIKPIPIKVIIYDTIYVQKKESWYDSVYIGNGWRFRWGAHTFGELDEIYFSDFVIPRQIIRETRTVDTCFAKEPQYKAKSHLWLYLKPQIAFSPFTISNVTAGLQYTRKGKWGIGIGGGYDWIMESPTIEGTLLINIK